MTKTTRGYWSDEFRNKNGEDLDTCLRLYGWGVNRDVQRALKITVIFLDDTRSFGNSWLIRMDERNTFCRVRLYAEDEHVRIKVIQLQPQTQHG